MITNNQKALTMHWEATRKSFGKQNSFLPGHNVRIKADHVHSQGIVSTGTLGTISWSAGRYVGVYCQPEGMAKLTLRLTSQDVVRLNRGTTATKGEQEP